MPQGLPRKIRIAFIIQVVLASLAIVLGVFLVSAVIKHSLINTALQEEAAHYWDLYGASQTQPPPNTYNIRGYLVPRGRSNLLLPENLRTLKPGFYELKDDDLLVLVDEKPAGRLYLVFLRSQAERLAFYFGTLPIILTLIAIYAVSWLTYRASKRLVSPVSWLAEQVIALGSAWPRYQQPGAGQAASRRAGRSAAAGLGAARPGPSGVGACRTRTGLHPRREP